MSIRQRPDYSWVKRIGTPSSQKLLGTITKWFCNKGSEGFGFISEITDALSPEQFFCHPANIADLRGGEKVIQQGLVRRTLVKFKPA